MAQRVYEGLFLLDSNRYARDPGGVSAQIGQTIKDLGGEMLASRLWNEQKLAYPVDGHRKGTYWLSYFRIDSGKMVAINRQFQLNEAVLRSLVLAVDDRLVNTLVQHALQGTRAAEVRKTEPEVKVHGAVDSSEELVPEEAEVEA